MRYDSIAIPDADLPRAVGPVFQHAVTTYAGEANKTASVWRAVPDDSLDFRPREKTNPIRTILAHQLLSERRLCGQFVGTEEPPVEELLAGGERPVVQAHIDKYLWLVGGRLPQLARGTTPWRLEQRPFFGGMRRERVRVFWRRVLRTCHHRTRVQSWLRLAGRHVPAIYGPSGDVGRGRPDVLAGGGEAGRPVVPRRTRCRGPRITAARGRPPRTPGIGRWRARGEPAR